MKTTVYSNPFREAEAKRDAWQEVKRKKNEKIEQKRAALESGEGPGYFYSQPLRRDTTAQATQRSGVGKYLPSSALANKRSTASGGAASGSEPQKKKSKTSKGFDFSRW